MLIELILPLVLVILDFMMIIPNVNNVFILARIVIIPMIVLLVLLEEIEKMLH